MRITRGRAWILVHGRPPDRLELSSGWIPRYTEALGAPPRGRVIVHVARAKGSEWLAAEFVLAAEEKWGGRFVLDDFAEEVVTLEEFHARLAERRSGFFWPGHDASPRALREARATPVEVLLPAQGHPRAVERFLMSLGAAMHPDADADASLARGNARLWVRLREPGVPPPYLPADLVRRLPALLGAPPHHSCTLHVFDTEDSPRLALEFLEALAAKWTLLLVLEPDFRVLTMDDVRAKAQDGSADPFRSDG
ncbi:MAG: hypothetical protein DIU60_006660 [Actinomycetes bacterium]|nr:MAG: hypothetical protein DIU60_05710 [Actinomycetota bacterium]